LKIYNLIGREVRTLVEGERPPGYHRVRWDGKNEAGQALPAGIYFVRMQAGEFTAVRKIMYMK
jgi:flagellar hook assembly protein FlgD